MTYQEALAKLRNHSNLQRAEDDQSLLYRLWRADREGVLSELALYVEDILVCL